MNGVRRAALQKALGRYAKANRSGGLRLLTPFESVQYAEGSAWAKISMARPAFLLD